jgi:hypothetical protein
MQLGAGYNGIMDYFALGLPTQLFGYAAVALLFISFQVNSRNNILGLLILGMVFLATHQYLLGAFAGAVANGLTIVRNLTFRHKNDSKVLNHYIWPYVFSVVLVVSGIFFWQGWHSLLPAFAVIASTFALWADDTRTIRILSLIGPLLWLPYAFIIESLPTILIQVVILSSIAIAMYRFDRK